MRTVATIGIYLAVLIRIITSYLDDPPGRPLVYLLLGIYGLALVSEPALTRRMRWHPPLYLILQAGLAVTVLLVAPFDFPAALFLALSFQAVLFFGQRVGFAWIAGFTLAMAGPLMIGWEWKPAGLVMVLAFGGLNAVMGSYAHLIRRAETARLENQRLLGELQGACRRLQDYAAELEELAAAQERHHMAQELHDSVTQTLFSMNLTAQGARLVAARDRGRLLEHLDRLQALARSASGELQALDRQLQPRSVAEEGLAAALHRLAAERQARDGLHVSLEVSGEKSLPEAVSVGLYRIAQEALNNVAKHAGTCEVVVRLSLGSSPAYLEVEDQGCGFEVGRAAGGVEHIGLTGMADRAREMDWRLLVDSRPGHGTRVRAQENADGRLNR